LAESRGGGISWRSACAELSEVVVLVVPVLVESCGTGGGGGIERGTAGRVSLRGCGTDDVPRRPEPIAA